MSISVLVLTAVIFSVISFLRRKRNNRSQVSSLCSKNSLVVGVDATYVPVEFVGKEDASFGFDLDYAQEIARALNKDLQVKNIRSDAFIPALNHGEVDFVIGSHVTPDNLRKIDMISYHGESLKSFALLFWQSVPPGIFGLGDFRYLANTKIAVKYASLQEEFVQRNEHVSSKPYTTMASLVLALRQGVVGAALVKPDDAYVLQSEHPKLKIVEILLDQDEWILPNSIAVRKGNGELLAKLNQTIKNLNEEGITSKIHQKWLNGSCCKSK